MHTELQVSFEPGPLSEFLMYRETGAICLDVDLARVYRSTKGVSAGDLIATVYDHLSEKIHGAHAPSEYMCVHTC